MASKNVRLKNLRVELPGELRGDTWEFPTVSSVTTAGKQTFWKIYVRMLVNGVFVKIPESVFVDPAYVCIGWIKVDYGQVGGKIKDAPPTFVRVGKNIGRSNQTNPFTQALSEAHSKYKKQVQVSAKSMHAGENTLFPPMLAQVLSAQKKQPLPPYIVQPKFNGLRAVTAPGGDVMYSRKRHLYPGFVYLKREMEYIYAVMDEAVTAKQPIVPAGWTSENVYFDGEIYSHGTSLQVISGISRRIDQPDDVKLDYMVYDCFAIIDGAVTDTSASVRQSFLSGLLGGLHDLEYVKPVETETVSTLDGVTALYGKYLAAGYEGAMIRTDDPYKCSYNENHSKVLLKIKPTFDAEYEITGYVAGGKGKSADAFVLKCRIGDHEFNVTPAMEIEERNTLSAAMAAIEENGLTHFENTYLGKKVIVYYDELSTNGVPQRARTKMEIRDWD